MLSAQHLEQTYKLIVWAKAGIFHKIKESHQANEVDEDIHRFIGSVLKTTDRKTLGQLGVEIRKKTACHEKHSEIMLLALQARNSLSHEYLRKHHQELELDEIGQEMEADLKLMKCQIEDACIAFNELLRNNLPE